MAWSRLQSFSYCSSNSWVTTAAATPSTANLSAGSKLIALTTIYSGNTVSGVADAAANAFTSVLGFTANGTDVHIGLWVLDTPPGDVGIKPAITATSASGGWMSIEVQEVAGLLAGTTAALDGTPGTANGSGNPTSPFSAGSPVYASAAPGEYLLSLIAAFSTAVSGTDSAAPAAGTPDPANSATFGQLCCLAYGSSAGGTETGGWTATPAVSGEYIGWGTALAAFKLAATSSQSGPNYAGTAADLGGGSGTWAGTANADGAPDSAYATWTVP